MDGIFRDRERGFEARVEFEQAQLFKIRSRRDRLFGEWAARQMWLTGPAAADYANEVIASNFQRKGDDDMLEKVAADLRTAGLDADTKLLRAELAAAEMAALREVAEQDSSPLSTP